MGYVHKGIFYKVFRILKPNFKVLMKLKFANMLNLILEFVLELVNVPCVIFHTFLFRSCRGELEWVLLG